MTRRSRCLGAVATLLALAACDASTTRGDAQQARETRFPGTITAGGGTSGEVVAASKAKGVNPNESGTPGIPKGAEGNVGGTQLGGTAGASSLGGTGEKSREQAAKAAADPAPSTAPPSPAPR